MSPQLAIFGLWGAWILSWTVAALWADRPVARPGVALQAFHSAATVLGFCLMLGVRTHPHRGPGRLWDVGDPVGWALLGLAAAGLALCWWARLHLGRLWSGSVSRKAGHRIVDTGPYALVRHPIYTGLIVAAFATGALRGAVPPLSAGVVLTVGFFIKARQEERFLGRELGEADYEAYRRRVPMLVPRIPRRWWKPRGAV